VETPFRSPKGTVRPARKRGLTSRIAVLSVVVALPLAAGCAAGTSAQTQKQYQPAVGADDREGQVYALNMLVVADDQGRGTLVGTLINQASCPDYVVDIQAVDDKGGGVETGALPAAKTLDTPEGCPSTAPDKGLALPSQVPAKFPDDALVQLDSPHASPGTFVTLTLRFQEAAPLEIDVPVQPVSDVVYSGITVGPIEQPTTSGATPN
jgi:hypothetical protein